MKLTYTNIFFILLCLSLFSCKKKVDENNRPEFVGHWYCPYGDSGSGTEDFSYDITVDDNSNAIYTSHTTLGGGDVSTIHGTARANDRHFKIGRIYSFKVIEYPHKIDTTSSIFIVDGKKANWKMTLKGPIFHDGDGSYYKADY